ncbi:UDP-glucose 4-epimerase [Candidatus Gottesmanbacteria bacterium RIFCSPHIGHO2_02_FULL_39_14]|uniref:UDP-glucose 4-epimerase n=1 Tax=Candidatus Gottesmanbacteria bacterium RIFCSPHIGHO2_02_FULL_39_14 TaxID=1798383 RepID=A0A1F6A148_9BACT|nr:MAG: UDP-glucose 4-epimerase [Candidatus Gottesmanbacteria bacterium RIFCSPHIGHO2_02_FULL_39_14]
MHNSINSVLVTGGGGYVGVVLVPKLLQAGYRVKVIDWYIYGDKLFSKHKNLLEIKGDIRNKKLLIKELRGIDAVIHLAAISNDPTFDLNPNLAKSVNFEASKMLAELSLESNVKRFIFISTSSVYGIKKEKYVTENLPLKPLTDYSKYKALSEKYVLSKSKPGFTVLVLRPATVCGYSPRMRFDLTVNLLTIQALVRKKIAVFGGKQLRPNIHIEDITDLYVKSLKYPDEAIARKIFNAGYENLSVSAIARLVKNVLNDPAVAISVSPTADLRSYHISSQKIARELGFFPKHTVEEAIRDIKKAYENGLFIKPLENELYYNLKLMKKIKLK